MTPITAVRRLSKESIFVGLTLASCVTWLAVMIAVYAPTPAAWQLYGAQTALIPEILTHVPQGAGALLPVLLFLFAAAAPGHYTLRALKLEWANGAERWLTEIAVGLVVITFAVIVLGEAGLLYPAVLRSLLAVCLALSAWLLRRWWVANGIELKRSVTERWAQRSAQDAWIWVTLAFVAFTLYVSFLGALVPEHGYDARWYHLAEAKRFADHHRLFSMLASEHNVQLGLPHYQEILYAALVSAAGLGAAKVFAWADGLLAVLGILMFAWTHLRSWLAAAVAAAVFIDTPIIAWSGTTASTDLPLALYTLLVVHTFLRWYDSGNARWLVVTGLLGGYTLGIKPFGIFALASLAVVMLVRVYREHRANPVRAGGGIPAPASELMKQRFWRPVVTMSAAALAAYVPWLAVSYIDSGNPFFPFLGSVFHSPYWDPQIDAIVRSSYQLWGASPVTPLGIFTIPWRVVTEVDKYRSVIGPVYLALAPLWVGAVLLWANPRTHLRLLLGFFGVWGLMWYYSGALDGRYAEAVFPLISVMVAYPLTLTFATQAARAAKALAVGLIVIAGALNTQFLLPLQKGAELPQVSGPILLPEGYLFAGHSGDEIQLAYMPMVSYMNKTLSPSTDKVFDDTELVVFNVYSDIDFFNGNEYDSPAQLGQWALTSPDALAHLRAEHVTHIVTFRSRLAPLRKAPLWPHLRLLHREPSLVNGSKPAFDEFLFQVRY